jgi:two-component system response regulator AlgR
VVEEAPLRILVVDDEPLAVERLQLLLARCDGVAMVGTANDGEAALRIAEAVKPDLVLLDIAMPGMDGIDVARALSASKVAPMVIFATAFDNFAVAAFDIAAVDYLMKPVELDRLQRSLERARRQRGAAAADGAKAGSGFVEDFWVPDHSGLVRIAARDIERITKLEQDLDPALFIRVHRSVMLRRDTIAGLYRDEGGHWVARLADGGEQRIGRSYSDDVKRLAGRA